MAAIEYIVAVGETAREAVTAIVEEILEVKLAPVRDYLEGRVAGVVVQVAKHDYEDDDAITWSRHPVVVELEPVPDEHLVENTKRQKQFARRVFEAFADHNVPVMLVEGLGVKLDERWPAAAQ